MVGVKRHIDAVAVAVAGLIDGVGNDLKNRVGAALHAIGAKNDGRALADTVGALQAFDAFVSVFFFSFSHETVLPVR